MHLKKEKKIHNTFWNSNQTQFDMNTKIIKLDVIKYVLNILQSEEIERDFQKRRWLLHSLISIKKLWVKIGVSFYIHLLPFPIIPFKKKKHIFGQYRPFLSRKIRLNNILFFVYNYWFLIITVHTSDYDLKKKQLGFIFIPGFIM